MVLILFDIILSKFSLLQNKYYFLSMTSFGCLQVSFIRSCGKCSPHNNINSMDPAIQFTTEEQKQDGSMPFLDILVTPQEDGSLTTRVYRKPTHTEQYLQWDSHHNLASKYSVINTLIHRAKAVWSSSQLLKEELKHVEEVLTQCKYPRWAFQKILREQENKKKKKRKERNITTQKRCHIVVPYTKGLCESYKSICSKYGVQAYFKGNKLKNLLMLPKDKDEMKKQSNIIYCYRCGRNVMMSILGSQPGPLKKDLKYI